MSIDYCVFPCHLSCRCDYRGLWVLSVLKSVHCQFTVHYHCSVTKWFHHVLDQWDCSLGWVSPGCTRNLNMCPGGPSSVVRVVVFIPCVMDLYTLSWWFVADYGDHKPSCLDRLTPGLSPFFVGVDCLFMTFVQVSILWRSIFVVVPQIDLGLGGVTGPSLDLPEGTRSMNTSLVCCDRGL